MRWTGQVACMVERTGVYRVLVGQPEGRDYFEELSTYLSIIRKWTFKKWNRKAQT
jgi:hypothetical protein